MRMDNLVNKNTGLLSNSISIVNKTKICRKITMEIRKRLPQDTKEMAFSLMMAPKLTAKPDMKKMYSK